VVSCLPEQYDEILAELQKNKGQTTLEFRRKLAQAVFQRTAQYDTFIARYFSDQISEGVSAELPDSLKLDLAQYQHLRYGENPHQAAVWYSDGRFGGNQIEGFPPFEQLQGKELSSNNITDTYCLVNILRDIGTPAACIIKHNNPCGVAVGKTLEEAYDKAHSTDPEAAFGGIFGFTEAGTGQPAVLLVVQGDALAHALGDLGGDVFVAHREGEDLRRRARQAHHRNLAFPGLAQPAAARELLYVPGTLALGVRPVEHHPREAREPENARDQETTQELAHRETRETCPPGTRSIPVAAAARLRSLFGAPRGRCARAATWSHNA